MALPRSKKLLGNARALRKEMTKEERHLWYDFLRHHPLKFYRQKPIGNYIADFYCLSARLVIELDGGQHYEPPGQEKDRIRTEDLEKLGLHVLRFSNLDVMKNFEGVCQAIQIELSRCVPGYKPPL